MADNQIGGEILTCLVGISTLQSIDFANNDFGSIPTTKSQILFTFERPTSP